MKFIKYKKNNIPQQNISNWVLKVILSCTNKEQVRTASKIYYNYCKLYQPSTRIKWDLNTQLVLKRNSFELN